MGGGGLMGYVVAGASYTGDVLIRNANGDLVDPDVGTLSLVIRDPDGEIHVTLAENDLDRVGPGHYQYAWATEAGFANVVPWRWEWDADLDGADLPDNVVDVLVLPQGSLATTFVPIDQVRALVKTALSDSQLQAVIEREEAVLAAEVGPLGGLRVETFTITDRSSAYPIRLRRPTGAIAITEGNVSVTDVRLTADGRTVVRLVPSGWASLPWGAVVEATYTPNDAARVTTWVIELVRARLALTGYLDEEKPEALDYETTLQAAIDDILGRSARKPRRGLRSVRMSSSGGAAPWLGGVRP